MSQSAALRLAQDRFSGLVVGELYGYGADLGGLGIYIAGENDEAFRLFVPVGGIESFSVGERLGKLLLQRGQLTSNGLELALESQRGLRKQRLGGLFSEHVVPNSGSDFYP